jgi:hypothetical protein
MNNFVICSKSLETGETWKGSSRFTHEQASDIAVELNEDYAVVTVHWVEPFVCPIHDFEAPCPSCALVAISAGVGE